MLKMITSLIVFSTLNAFASDVNVVSCSDYSVSLNSVYSMKTYANESIKIFEIDMEEPAAAPAGVAIAIDRGDDLSTAESFCRFIPGFSRVNVVGGKSKYNVATNILTLTLNAAKSDENGAPISKVLTITINKGALSEAELVKAKLN